MKRNIPKIFLYLFFSTPFLAPIVTYLFTFLFLAEPWLIPANILFLIMILETFFFLPILILFFIEKELIQLTPFYVKIIVNTFIYAGIVVLLSYLTTDIETSPFFKTLMYINTFWIVLNYNVFEVLNRKKQLT